MISFATPSREFLKKVDPQDLFHFMNYAIDRLSGMKISQSDICIYINEKKSYKKDAYRVNHLMTNREIYFQVFGKDINYFGKWTNYRAIDFCCMNQSIVLTPEPISEEVICKP